MADEAFALSPISARASLPSEEDYDAISHAFMETSRGRWFLGEYAKRNRNADTRMVLDAVAKIEQTLAAQKQPPADNGLADALIAIRRAVDEAQASATVAVENLAADENLAPIRKGARIIREISWRWREIGADGRICDLLDSQVGAIEGACGQIAEANPQATLSAAFDLIKQRIAGFDKSEPDGPQTAEESVPPAAAAVPEQAAVAEVEPVPTATAAVEPEAAISMPVAAVEAPVETAKAPAEVAAPPVETADVAAEAADETSEMAPEAAEVAAEAAHVAADTDGENPDAAEAYDDALLDQIALEMGAPEPDEPDDLPDEAASAEPQPAEPMIATWPEPIAAPEPPAPAVAAAPEPASAPEPAAIQPSLPSALQPSLHLVPETVQPPVEPSLGSSLLASGIVRRPQVPTSDPLAPIRRMSQAERIALFS